MPKEEFQWKMRHSSYFEDQHGREWWAPRDKDSMAAAAVYQPRFKAPWLPEQKYLERHPRKLDHIVVNYRQMAHDYKDFQAQWDTGLRAIVRSNYPSESITVLKNPPKEALDMAGPRPLPRIVIAKASSGDPWLMGETDVRPSWVTDEIMEAIDRAMNRVPSFDILSTEDDEEIVQAELAEETVPQVAEQQAARRAARRRERVPATAA